MPEKKLGIVGKVKAAAQAVVKAVTPAPPHKCDPEGWYCDCERRREINANSRRNGAGSFLGRRRNGWLR